jgi:biopolymer transport protein ExbD
MIAKKKIFALSIVSITTLLVILFCIIVMLKNKTFERENLFSLALPPENFYEDICGCSLEKVLSFRKFKSYELTIQNDEKQKQFGQIQTDIRNIVTRNDSENGIHVKINKKTSYGDVVRILDICEIEKAPTYILKDYDIWIMTGRNAELEKNCPMRKPKQ